MPIYEYQCDACQHKFETIQKFTDPLLEECPECKEKALRKLVSAAAFRLKGTGWYVTDFKDKPSSKADDKSKSSSEKTDSEKPQKKEEKSTSTSNGDNKGSKQGSTNSTKKTNPKTD